jgi:hypothetical protein
MIDRYNARIHELGDIVVQAYMGNLLESPPSPVSLANDTYYLVIVGQALHFFSDAEQLVDRLRPGAVPFVQNLLDDGKKMIPRGFGLDELRG